MTSTEEVQAIPVTTATTDTELSEKTAALNIQTESQAESSKASSIKDTPPAYSAHVEVPRVAEAPAASIEHLAPKELIFTPIPHALPHCKPDAHLDLTDAQSKKYEDLLDSVKSWTEIPATLAKNSPTEPINDTDRLWLTRDCLLRYLRATKWLPTEAAKRLLATLTWQREYGVRHKITPEYVSEENETGKQIIQGFDNNARPCLFLNPGKQNTKFSERQNNHLVFMLERVIDLMEPGQESTSLLVNYKDTSSSKNPPMAQSRAVLHILQTHYPERLGRALISDRTSLRTSSRLITLLTRDTVPWYVNAFYKLISPFIDPVTTSKMKFNEPLINHVPAEQLLKHYGGNVEFEYKHDVYWPALVELCDSRRGEYIARWEKAGKQMGEVEKYLRGGDALSLDGKHNGSDAI